MYTSQLKRAGYTLRQLNSWVKLGLLHSPEATRVGLGRGKGWHEKNWPGDTVKRAEIIVSGFRQHYDRLEIALELYLQGYVVPDVLLLRDAIVRQYRRAAKIIGTPKQVQRHIQRKMPTLDRQTKALTTLSVEAVTGKRPYATDEHILVNADFQSNADLLQDCDAATIRQAISQLEAFLVTQRTELRLLEATVILGAKKEGFILTAEDMGGFALLGHQCLQGHSMLEAERVNFLPFAIIPLEPGYIEAWDALRKEWLAISEARP